MTSAAAECTRWRRFGHDRLYAKDESGEDLGYWDLRTDEAHPLSAITAVALDAAVASWKAARDVATEVAVPLAADPAPAAVVAAEAVSSPADQHPWVDLSVATAGEGVAARADSAFLAAPIRSSMAQLLGVHTEERAWRMGRIGEEKVGAQLTKLLRKDSRWRVLHSVPVGNRGADIDHVVIGPGGVFTLNAKHHKGADIWVGGNTVMVNGHRTSYVHDSRREAQRASKLLGVACGFPVHVEGMIITVNAHDFVAKSQPQGVHVLPRVQLVDRLRRFGRVLNDDTVDAIFEVARRSTTWR